jgi:hypothetical protein
MSGRMSVHMFAASDKTARMCPDRGTAHTVAAAAVRSAEHS